MELLRCKLAAQKLKSLGLQDLHPQIMGYIEYDNRSKLFNYVSSASLRSSPQQF